MIWPCWRLTTSLIQPTPLFFLVQLITHLLGQLSNAIPLIILFRLLHVPLVEVDLVTNTILDQGCNVGWLQRIEFPTTRTRTC